MSISNEEVKEFLTKRIKYLKELKANNEPFIGEYIDDKIELFTQEYNSLFGECDHVWIVNELDENGDWIEAECMDCCLRKTNS